MPTATPTAFTTVVEYDEYGEGFLRRAYVDSDVLDIARRIREGDPVCGWRGDLTMALCAIPITDPVTGKRTHLWEVEADDLAGQRYVAASMIAERVDHRIIEKLVRGDWQQGRKLLDTVKEANRRHQAAADAARHEANEEWADKFHWAMCKDIGHLEGGTRRMTSMAGAHKEGDG